MLNLKIKSGSLKKKVIKSLKKKFTLKNIAAQTVHTSAARLPDLVITTVCPALAKTLSERENDLKQQETALEIREARFEAAKTAEAEKQARIRQGAATMFRANRIHSQQEIVKRQRAADDLETALCEVAQGELDTMDAKCDQSTTVLLLAAARHDVAAAVALEAKTEADKISAQLRKALEDAQAERTRLQALTAGVASRFEEAGSLVSSATVQQAKANEYLQTAVEHCAHFEVLIEAVQMRMEELHILVLAAKEDRTEASRQLHAAQEQAVRFVIAAEAISVTQEVVEREEAKVLEDARIEGRQGLAALADAQARFWKMRAMEKEYLAGRHAHLEELRTRMDTERKKVKEEKERIRVLEIKRELEMAASVEAKRAALADLEKAVCIRQQTTRDSLAAKQQAVEDLKVAGLPRKYSNAVVIAEDMASSIDAAMRSITTVPEIDEDRDGRMSRLGNYGDNRCSRIPTLKRNGEAGFKVHIDTDAGKKHRASVASRYQKALTPGNGGNKKRVEGKENYAGATAITSLGARGFFRLKASVKEGSKVGRAASTLGLAETWEKSN